jgi:hypothetical protein
VAKRPQLHCFGDYRHVDADLSGRVLDVVGDAVDQQRDMIEQLVRGKDPIRLDRDPPRDFREPGARQLTLPFAKANRERGGQRTVVGDRVRGQRALA